MKKSPESIKAQPNDKDFGMAHYSDVAISRFTADHIYNHSSDFPQALTVTWSQGCDTCVELVSRYRAKFFWDEFAFNKESACASTPNDDLEFYLMYDSAYV